MNGTPAGSWPGARPPLSLVVPLFNEEERLTERGPELVSFLDGYPAGSELILVDDGSEDATIDVAARLARDAPVPVRVIARPHAGKGAAVRAGLATAEAPYAGFCDVDLSTPLSQFELILQTAMRSPVLAIGSRDMAGSRLIRPQGRVRESLGKSFNALVQLTLAPGIADTQCGAKVARRDVWQGVLPWLHETGFVWDVELVAAARRMGLLVREVPVEWQHDDRSRVRVSRDGPRMVAALPRIARNIKAAPAATRSEGTPSGVFDESQAATLIESDTEHWWFRSKASFVSTALRRYAPATSEGWLVDVGAGAGGVTAMLGWTANRVVSIDGSEFLCREASNRHGVLSTVGDGERIPLRDKAADAVVMLDVLEHLDDPRDALTEVNRILSDDGVLVINVPAHRWLWSGADELLGHVRRYSRPMLREHVESCEFEITWMSHVFSWLALPTMIQRRLSTDQHRQLGLDRSSPLLDVAARVLTRMEQLVLRLITLPVGTSVLCVARKTGGRDGDAAPPAHKVGIAN